MEITNVFDRTEFSQAKQAKTVLKEHDKYKTLVIGLESAQEIPPCSMNRHTIFFVVQGSRTLVADGERSFVC
ncbi:MAG: hypothetical protein IMF26_01205 [Candidatus Fermentithermobacillus carboniphilus]|uniref:AraC family transcriptional regulator n=1 Tax=Candidatus Fermentithermobacillus carboniphilus TaxID=3085328 RepID=A0AAT9LCD4_9FIRM|nr:MAG: hypothetical protein IMF26_01205 [Candidatus Fermentithermobacillus carboniphilus]